MRLRNDGVSHLCYDPGVPDIDHLLHGEALRLLPERAVFWPRAGALIIADPHFGKAAAFRAGGVPVPGGTTVAMLRRLSAALDRTEATRLIILGDLLHARAGRAPRTLEIIAAWLAVRPGLRVTLVRGNHDREAGDPPAGWCIDCRDAPLDDPPFVWWHEPPAEPSAAGFPIAGHVHPGVALIRGGSSLTLPCYYFGRHYALLPAFGEFTGTAVVRPRAGERVYVLAGDEIIAK